MITLLEHIQSLAKRVAYTEEEILRLLVTETMIMMDEDSLLGYSFEELPEGKIIFAGWTSGDGQKIEQWIEDLAKKNKCVAIYGISRRWRAFQRKYNAVPVKDCGDKGVIFKREVEY